MAAHNSKGLVICQVERIVDRHTISARHAHIPGAIVDKARHSAVCTCQLCMYNLASGSQWGQDGPSRALRCSCCLRAVVHATAYDCVVPSHCICSYHHQQHKVNVGTLRHLMVCLLSPVRCCAAGNLCREAGHAACCSCPASAQRSAGATCAAQAPPLWAGLSTFVL